MSVAEECVQPEELRNLLEKKPNPIAYDGFEPSGRMHIAQVSKLAHWYYLLVFMPENTTPTAQSLRSHGACMRRAS